MIFTLGLAVSAFGLTPAADASSSVGASIGWNHPAVVDYSVALSSAGPPSDPYADASERVSVSSAGDDANGDSYSATHSSISADGRFVVFRSYATNLIADDTNGSRDVFLRDTQSGTTSRLSVSSNGSQGNGDSFSPVISADGTKVVFASDASNLVPGDTNGVTDVFLRDVPTGTTTRLSVSSTGNEANDVSAPRAISSNGNVVAFTSSATNLVTDVSEQSSLYRQLYLRSVDTDRTVMVSEYGGVAGVGSFMYGASLSADGQTVAFSAQADYGQSADAEASVWVRRMSTGDFTLITPASSQFSRTARWPVLSADGSSVAFVSDMTTYGATSPGRNHLVVAGTTSPGGKSVYPIKSGSGNPSMSSDGRFVGYESGSRLLVVDLLTRRLQAVPSGGSGVSLAGDGSSLALTSGVTSTVLKVDRRKLPAAVPDSQADGCAAQRTAWTATVCHADPVNTATGTYTSHTKDVSLPGRGVTFSLFREYSSGSTLVGDFGIGWTSALSMRLVADGTDKQVLHSGGVPQLEFFQKSDGSFAAPAGTTATLTRTADGFQLQLKSAETSHFDASGKLLRTVDRNGNGLTFGYGADGRINKVTDAAGRQVSISRNTAGRVTLISLPDGRQVGYTYVSNRLTGVTDLLGGTTTYTYDASNRLTDVTDQRGNAVVHNVYGADGRIASQTSPTHGTVTFSWDPITQTSTMTDARGGEWVEVYSSNVLVSRKDPLGNTTTFAYNADLTLRRMTDARGFATEMSYDARGNMLSRTGPAPSSITETFSYDSADRLLAQTNGRGHTTTYSYDAAGNMASVQLPDGQRTEYSYDTSGNGDLVAVTDPRGKIAQFGYDAAGNRIRVTTPTGDITTFTYDGSGRLVSVVDPRGNITGADPNAYRTSYTHDAADNTTSVTDPLGGRASSTYDSTGNLTQRTDANGHITTYTYDQGNRLTKVTAADLTETSYGYDTSDNLVSRIDAKQRTTTFAYDLANQLTRVNSPGSRVWTYEHDPAGNLAKTVDAKGNATTATTTDGTTVLNYDEVNRLVGVDYSDVTPDASYVYDEADNRVGMTDGSGTTSYTYDASNRLTAATRGTRVLGYSWDPAGNVTSQSYPDGSQVSYTYDDNSRLSTVASGTPTTRYSYTPAGQIARVALPPGNGHVEERDYDRAGRLTRIRSVKAGNVLNSFTYTLDPVGNPTTVATPTTTQTATYDPLDRLTGYCLNSDCTDYRNYTYDAVGNRLSEQAPSGTTTYAYNAADEMTSITPPGATTQTVGYDKNGNQLSVLGGTASYDQANRLAKYVKTIDGVVNTTTYTYNADGLWQTKKLAISGAGTTTTTSPGARSAYPQSSWKPMAATPPCVATPTAPTCSA